MVTGQGSGGGSGAFREEETEGAAARLGRGWGLWSRWHGLGGNGVAEKDTNQTEKWVRNCDYVCQRGGVQGRKGRFLAKARRTGGMGGKQQAVGGRDRMSEK